jgi:hypothetical protein
MKTKFALALVFAITLVFSSAYAQKGYKDFRDRDHGYGYQHGRISKVEHHRISKQRKALKRDIRRAKCNDGRISRSERIRIEREWKAMNRDMHRYRNNNNRW